MVLRTITNHSLHWCYEKWDPHVYWALPIVNEDPRVLPTNEEAKVLYEGHVMTPLAYSLYNLESDTTRNELVKSIMQGIPISEKPIEDT